MADSLDTESDSGRTERERLESSDAADRESESESTDEATQASEAGEIHHWSENDLLNLLLPPNLRETELPEELEDWSKDLADNVTRSRVSSCLGPSNVRVLQSTLQLHMLLMDSVMTQRWQQALHTAMLLAKEPVVPSDSIATVAMAVFSRYPGNDVHLDKLINALRCVSVTDKKELTLSYALNFMKEGHLPEAHTQFKVEMRKPGGFRRQHVSDRESDTAQLYQAYYGLLWYTEWLKVKNALKDLTHAQRDSVTDIEAERSLLEAQLSSLSTRVLERMQGITERRGCADVFITKIVEVYTASGQLDEAQDVLEKYAEKNPDNPNASLYLYQFLNVHQLDEERQVELLQKFCNAIPAHPLALDLHTKLRSKGHRAGECLYLLFDLLDYPCHAGLTCAWQQLHDQLVCIATSAEADDVKEFGACWSERCDWWPRSHFHPRSLSQLPAACRPVKAGVALLLTGPDNEFTSQAKREADCSDSWLQRLKTAEVYHYKLMPS